jgi:hypothetical protein
VRACATDKVVAQTQSLVRGMGCLVELRLLGPGFRRTDHAHGGVQFRPGEQFGKVPQQTVSRMVLALLRLRLSPEPGGILVQIAPFVLQDDECSLPRASTKFKKGAVL